MSGNFKTYNICRFCESKNILDFLDLGNQALAGGFLDNSSCFKTEKLYPLVLYFCKDCYLVSVKHIVDGDVLFKNYYYRTSTIPSLVKHFEEYSNIISELLETRSVNGNVRGNDFKTRSAPVQAGSGLARSGNVGAQSRLDLAQASSDFKNSKILEIGCNDSGVISHLHKKGYECIGVDPSNVILESKDKLHTYNTFFDEKLSKNILEKHGKIDCITSSNCLAHIEDMDTVMKGISSLLSDDGYFIMEVHYLPKITEELQYDMIYSEHMSYYSVSCLDKFLKRYNLNIIKVEEIPIHGGSIRVFCQLGCRKSLNKSVDIYLEKERKMTDIKYYQNFQEKVEDNKKNLLKAISELKGDIYGYGASGRANTIMGYCGIDGKTIKYMIDDSSSRIGKYTPFNHLSIRKLDLEEINGNNIILFAWSYKDFILKKLEKFKGKILIPLPEIKLISQ